MPASSKQRYFATLEDFEDAVRSLRPQIHRYCAHMAGSVIDGEDIVQSTFIKAFEALKRGDKVEKIEPWLYRIAHNNAMDLLRMRKFEIVMTDEHLDAEQENPVSELSILINDNLRLLLALPPLQRSVLILRELFGYTAEEISELLDTTVSAVKSALHRGRKNVQQGPVVNDKSALPPTTEDKARLHAYSTFFNERNFEQLRHLLTAEVRLDLVDKSRRSGNKDVGEYFSNYERLNDCYLAPGTIEGKPAILAFDRAKTNQTPIYFILLNYDDDGLNFIKDFRYARYVMDDADWELLEPSPR